MVKKQMFIINSSKHIELVHSYEEGTIRILMENGEVLTVKDERIYKKEKIRTIIENEEIQQHLSCLKILSKHLYPIAYPYTSDFLLSIHRPNVSHPHFKKRIYFTLNQSEITFIYNRENQHVYLKYGEQDILAHHLFTAGQKRIIEEAIKSHL